MRLLDATEMGIAADALSSRSGSGVARALFFCRTGDLAHREVLRRLAKLRTNFGFHPRFCVVRNQATVGVCTRGGEHGALGSVHEEEEEER